MTGESLMLFFSQFRYQTFSRSLPRARSTRPTLDPSKAMPHLLCNGTGERSLMRARCRSGPALMIVPPGTFDLSQYTRESTMNFSISGLKSTEHGSISMPLSNVFVEPNTGVKVMVHVPPVSNANGAGT